MFTPIDCFGFPQFVEFWEAVEALTDHHGWDDGPMLTLLVDSFNNGDTPEQIAPVALEEWQRGQAEAEMAIPSWA
jgi:hypothetical protein